VVQVALGRRFIGIDVADAAIKATVKRLAQGRSAMGDFVGERGRQAKPQQDVTGTLFAEA
jgi:hypothetical protein